MSPSQALIKAIKPVFPEAQFSEKWPSDYSSLTFPYAVIQWLEQSKTDYKCMDLLGQDGCLNVYNTGYLKNHYAFHYFYKDGQDYRFILKQMRRVFYGDTGINHIGGSKIEVKTGERDWEYAIFQLDISELGSSERGLKGGEKRIIFQITGYEPEIIRQKSDNLVNEKEK